MSVALCFSKLERGSGRISRNSFRTSRSCVARGAWRGIKAGEEDNHTGIGGGSGPLRHVLYHQRVLLMHRCAGSVLFSGWLVLESRWPTAPEHRYSNAYILFQHSSPSRSTPLRVVLHIRTVYPYMYFVSRPILHPTVFPSSTRMRRNTDLPSLPSHRSTPHRPPPPPPPPPPHPPPFLLPPHNSNPPSCNPAPSTSPASSSPSSPWNSSSTTCTSSPSRTRARLPGTVWARWRWWAFGIWFLFG